MRPRFSLLIPCHTQLQLHQWWRWGGGGVIQSIKKEIEACCCACLNLSERVCSAVNTHACHVFFFWFFFCSFFWTEALKETRVRPVRVFQKNIFLKVQVRAELVPSVQCTASLRIMNCYFFGYLPCVQVGFIRVFSVSLDGELRQFQTLWDSMLQSRLSRVSYRIQTPLPFPPNT